MARLGLIDDHPLFLDGLQTFLRAHGHDVALKAASAADYLDRREEVDEDVDLLIVDINMRGGSGIDLLESLNEAGRHPPVMLLSAAVEPEQVLRAMELSASAIVLKNDDPDILLNAISTVMDGGTHIDALLMEQALRHHMANRRTGALRRVPLTDREEQIASLVCRGLRNKAIAQECGVTEGTVKIHLTSIFRKLGIESRAELIVSGYFKSDQD